MPVDPCGPLSRAERGPPGSMRKGTARAPARSGDSPVAGGERSMSSKHGARPVVESLDPKVLLSSLTPAHARNVDVTGEVMRMNLTTPPRAINRTIRVYNFQGTGGVDDMGSVQDRGAATETVRGGVHAYKGNLTLSNSMGTV